MVEEIDETIEENELEEEEGGVEVPPKVPGDEEGGEEGGEEEEVVEPFKQFATQEEHDAYIQEQIAKAQQTPPETPPAETPPAEGDPQIFEEGWKPKNWNDFAVQLLKSPAAIEQMTKHLAPEAAKAIQDMSQAEQKELEEINAGFDSEYDGLSKEGKVPARDSEEGQKINEQITQIGAQYGLPSMTKAYELWAKIPQAEGGGLEYEPPATQKLNQQKKRSGLVGKPKGGKAPSNTNKPSAKHIHETSLDDLIDEEDLD